MNGADDDLTLERLAGMAAQLDPPPPQVTAAAMDAYIWRSVDAELADLVYDSWLDDRPLAGVRAAGGPRRLRFDSADCTVEVEFESKGAGPGQLTGQVVPPQEGTVEVRNAEQHLSVPVDQLGRFMVERLPPGHVSLRYQATDGFSAETAWIIAR